ncbi:MAG: hypothetical protein N3C12_00760 [Candidatus Binatia bacterium]|nr:hypothetical protein [Candidatus Binatia bacterium]
MRKKTKTATDTVPTEPSSAPAAPVPETPEATTPRRRRKTAAKATEQLAQSVQSPPQPIPRRAVFIDVENTTAEPSLFEVLRSLEIDLQRQNIELTAVGNWRAVPPGLARRLASMGAKLIHSAPARGVRDWSDLWIATAAGCWLGQARPGDVLEVISNDRAFDAIGDLAAARGVTFRRISHSRPAAATAVAKEHGPAAAPLATGLRKRRSAAASAPSNPAAEAPHAAPAEQIIATIEHLTKGERGRWVNLDVLERALKEQGFVRPPGSPRLVTRLRALRQVEVDAHGRVRIRVPAEGEAATATASSS